LIQNNILNLVGNTPLLKLTMSELKQLNIFAKLEMFNPTGSVKDRAASYILEKLIECGTINKDTVIIESSSGNFGLALSAACRWLGLKFYCVIDKNTMPDNEMLISALSDKVFKITEPDEYGGYLLNRIKKVKELVENIPNSYWINQYENPLNAEAYYHTLASELIESVKKIDYVFMGVSSGGTITGVSNRIKEYFPESRIIAVDIYGSVIFGSQPRKRSIPGIGSSKYPLILNKAKIDDHVMVSELETVNMCQRLLKEYFILAGGSSGSVMSAILKYFTQNLPDREINVVTVFPDRGDRYTSTIYNPDWKLTSEKEIEHVISK